MTQQRTPDDTPIDTSASFRVVASGHALAGFDAAQVQAQLEQRLKLPAATATRLLAGKPVVLKRDIDATTAAEYCQRLRAAGLDVVAVADDNTAKPTPASAPPTPVASPPTSASPTPRFSSPTARHH